jgi:hypothetical protein
MEDTQKEIVCEVLARAVEAAKAHTEELNSGPMKHTLAKRARLEKSKGKRR